MSYCQKQGPAGKDLVIFATKEDHAVPSTITLPEPEQDPGLILPNGDINWNCPCLGGMATGPCGVPFRDAFSCFHYSVSEPKGGDCFEKFKEMQDCMAEYPSLYNKHMNDDEDDDSSNVTLESAFGQSDDVSNASTDSTVVLSADANIINIEETSRSGAQENIVKKAD